MSTGSDRRNAPPIGALTRFRRAGVGCPSALGRPRPSSRGGRSLTGTSLCSVNVIKMHIDVSSDACCCWPHLLGRKR